MTTSNSKKFLLLVWKNWVIQKRHPIQTVVEIALPVLFCSLLILIRVLVDPGTMQSETHHTPLNLNELRLRSQIVTPAIDFTLAFTPPNPILESIVRSAATSLDMEVAPRDNRSALNIEVATFNMLAGVVFNESLRGIIELPKQLFYTLVFPSELRSTTIQTTFEAFNSNWMTNSLVPDFSFPPRNRFDADGGLPPAYHADGFLAIQNAISRAFINAHAGTDAFKEVFLQRYPYPAFKSDPFLSGIEFFIPLIILVSFFYSAINIVKYITLEKERQLKEVMKIMGLPNWLHWTAWFAKCFTFLFISVTLITIMLKVNFNPSEGTVVFAYADWSVIWVFLMAYSVVTIMFCFMWSVFFSKANTAAIIAGIMWFIFYTPYSIFSQNWGNMDFFTKFFVCLFSNTGMSFGFMLIVRHESTGIGVQWNNLFSPVTVDDNFSVGNVLIAFMVSAILYLCIALYFEKVFPGEYGVPEPWYFLFSKRFWSNKVEDKTVIEDMSSTNKQSMEADPEGKTAGIRIKGLTKSFAKNKFAVKNLHLNMFEDQITVLLGHNGAGKTTTMSMMTGIYQPTSGTAYIDGHDIRTNMDEARNSLGLCTQHNVLFDDLTVREHLTFFSRLKGYTSKQADADVRKYTELLDLLPKENKLSKTLSGGMKRKLAIGISLCGGSKIVLCDEPTSGMDPSARRFLWDLLEKEKKGRTILLTTHFMDEADVLGDRIAIMADGMLKCVGSSFFLKKKFGIGYRLVCVKDPGCESNIVTQLLQKFIPDIQKETDIGSELSYILNEDYASIFKDLLRELEDRSQEIHVASFGVSLTTLEEVFLKVGSDSHAFDEDEYVMPTTNGTIEMNGNGYQNGGSTDQLVLSKEFSLLTGSKLRLYQIEAMIRKKYLNATRSYVISLIQIFIPILFLVMTILTVRLFIATPPLSKLEIQLESYNQLVTILQTESFQTDDPLERISTEYKNIFAAQRPELRTLDVTNERIDRHFLNLAEESGKLALLNTQYMIGASVTATNITAWFNNEGLHTPPLATNILYNAQLRSVCPDCELRVAIDPLPFTTESEFLFLQAGNNLGFQLAFNTGFAMAFVSALFVLFYVRERVSRSKLLQFVSGTNITIFWTVSFLWDFLIFTISAVGFVIVLASFQEEGWSTFQEVGRFFLLLWFFGFGMLPLTYLGSFLTDVPSTGMTRLSMFYVFTGIIAFMAVFIIGSDLFDLKPLANTLGWIFLIFPHYAMSEGISNLNLVSSAIRFCNRQCELIPFCTQELMCNMFPNCCVTDFLTWQNPGIGRHLTFMVGTGVVCITVLFVKEYRLLEKVFNTGKQSIFSIPRPPPPEDHNMDDDVRREKERIAKMEYQEIKDKNLVLRDMMKYYGSFLAVNKISLSVDTEECFGLLGVNGAGKTSTFKMLTGDESISSGEAWVKGINIKTNMPEAHKEIGYCPQFDALLEDMTGRETLYIFALLRGIPRVQINSTILQLATSLNFVKHLDKETKQYSGGNKRKLSTALALLGNPSVIYLDEPTTGMDPGAKRHLWNIICKVRDSGISIILTSHSMEECEALCTKLAIMVNGEFKCLGSTQHLKNKFSKGYILNIKMKQMEDATPATRMTNSNEVKDYVTRSFQGAVLKEEHSDFICYHITSNVYKWSKIFEIMEDGKKMLQIEDYSLGQTSLEQVFLFFTKYQRNTDDK